MKKVVVWLLTGYQIFVSPLLYQLAGQQTACRYQVTCSEYAKKVILKHGVLTGGKMAFVRLLSCQPFGKIKSTIYG